MAKPYARVMMLADQVGLRIAIRCFSKGKTESSQLIRKLYTNVNKIYSVVRYFEKCYTHIFILS